MKNSVMISAPILLDLFCGRGGWSKPFLARGWECLGVDLVDFGYPGHFIQADVFSLAPDIFRSADLIIASPPCEEFARAWLPWLRGDKTPAQWAINLLQWSIALQSRFGIPVVVECSVFASRHVPGSVRYGSWCFWGDVPLLMPMPSRTKSHQWGGNGGSSRRAEVPQEFGFWLESYFSAQLSCLAAP